MFRPRRFIFSKTVVHTVMLWYGTVRYVLHAVITIKGFYKLPNYTVLELIKYIDIFKTFKYFTHRRLMSLFYCNYSMYNTVYRTVPYHTVPTYHNCIYNRLTEDEPSGSKHVEDIKK